MVRLALATALAAVCLHFSAEAVRAQSAPVRTFGGEQVRVTRVAAGLDHPWSIAFLPEGRLLVTEREGHLRVISRNGSVSPPIEGLPAVRAVGQGGLLDVALDPDFPRNRRVYVSYAEPRADGAGTAVARGRLSQDATRLDDVEVIFRQRPSGSGGNHFGSRLVFGRDGTLFVTLGDRFSMRDMAQDLSTTIGKVVRINPDGSVPADNPFRGRADALPEIWSYGHRNVQAAALDPRTGRLWAVEHGARGGDEANIPAAGKNYGWPVISYGRDYSGAKIGEGTAKPGLEQPVFYWDPSIAPSGAAFYDAALMPRWKGSLFVGALAGMSLVRLTLDGDSVTGEERLSLGKRVRDVRQGPDGALWLAIDDADGEILRIAPAR
ncbi:PQQ-dependent sugar dehydrogenase [Aquabacter spiritensis]|uniref:Glucose/arabinose dehydrogenase n=1 Tax=Aquabacter spiritensis TaxID=933073 RepID=A0A4R3LS66_9HYPH|nr:PQQ-dependent sugar dehydrogenase [Aquabacter spiritensis]TCT03191.1 glucose/arabinose dehydrogenase [Aquabacter spiritensis]